MQKGPTIRKLISEMKCPTSNERVWFGGKRTMAMEWFRNNSGTNTGFGEVVMNLSPLFLFFCEDFVEIVCVATIFVKFDNNIVGAVVGFLWDTIVCANFVCGLRGGKLCVFWVLSSRFNWMPWFDLTQNSWPNS